MALPAYRAEPHPDADDFKEALEEALDIEPLEVFKANYPLAVFATADEIMEAESDGMLADMLEEFDEDGIIITAAGGDTGFDFVSRFFVPGKGIAEDPVTGAAHAALVPFWAKRLGKAKLTRPPNERPRRHADLRRARRTRAAEGQSRAVSGRRRSGI